MPKNNLFKWGGGGTMGKNWEGVIEGLSRRLIEIYDKGFL
jgi:hypothetical protein